MRYLYKVLEVQLAAYQEGVEPILIATGTEIPRVTAIMNHNGHLYNTMAKLGSKMIANIGINHRQGFNLFWPLVVNMKAGQVFSVGFTNPSVASSTCKIVIQYYLL